MDKAFIFTLLKFNSTKPNSLIGHIFYNLHKFAPASEMPSESQQVSVVLCVYVTWYFHNDWCVLPKYSSIYEPTHKTHILLLPAFLRILNGIQKKRNSRQKSTTSLSSFVLFALSMFRYLPKAFFIFFKKKIRLRPDSPSRC